MPRGVFSNGFIALSLSVLAGGSGWAAEASADRMALIPGGELQMGSTDGDRDERPVHLLVVESFQMDVTEVTAESYQRCVAAGECRAPAGGKFCTFGQPDKARHPINCVTWREASQFCRSVGKRLPSEEEWEFAARGVEERKYPWGNQAPDGRVCARRWAPQPGTCPVGSFPTGDTPFGLHDMAGNVWEWTASGYSRRYNRRRRARSYVQRGGGWGDTKAAHFRATERDHHPADYRHSVIGFRCARGGAVSQAER
jgi:formylglycine-generating enzyme required for sulfatase activity